MEGWNLQQDDYRQEFAKLLRDTIIPAHIDNSSKHKSYHRLNGYIKENMPKSLYRYRSTEEHNIKALCRGCIPVTKPSEMGDVFDSQIAVDKKRVVNEIKAMERSIDTIANLIYEGKPIPEYALKAVSPQIRRVVVNNIHLAKSNLAIKPLMRFYAALIGRKLRKRVDNEYKRTIDVLRETGYIACFCEDVNKVTMWDRYADKHKGYALEYEFETLNARFHAVESTNKSLQPDYIVLPVIYGEMYDSTLIVLHSLMSEFTQDFGGKSAYVLHPDELWCIEGYLYKAADYDPEAEWRLITPMKGVARDKSPYANVNAPPKAIYYGSEMPDKMFQELDTIAITKGLKRYRMELIPLEMRVEVIPL